MRRLATRVKKFQPESTEFAGALPVSNGPLRPHTNMSSVPSGATWEETDAKWHENPH
jgi:hypothetical protein